MVSASPDGHKASELLMSDERELLKDLMCFQDSERENSQKLQAASAQKQLPSAS